jgi:cellulose synthase/poly-beta-1,6-N-acetylglucosamine synthase-like glycosyltransferase
MTALQALTAVAYLIALVGVALYAVNGWTLLALAWRRRRADAAPDPELSSLPAVTVQLPLYNERYVAARLLDAVAALDYPRDRLDIQVLDDSTDDTPAIVAHMVTAMRARGFDIAHVRRRRRVGFKAGALAEGLSRAKGEFTAIFDADFVPPPDMLRRMLAAFEPDVACVQGRWGHLNRAYSTLTRAQAMALDAQFAVEQRARAGNGLLLMFNGTGGIWRKSAIEDAGGWQSDTLSEDLDLSYRAQLRGWRIEYRQALECPAELPVLASAFKSQQRRWATGFTQTAVKHVRRVLASPLTAWQRFQACAHLTAYAVFPFVLTTLVLAPFVASDPATAPLAALGIPVLAIAVLGSMAQLLYGQHALGAPWSRRFVELPLATIYTAGLTFSTTVALVKALVCRRPPEWARTPKFGIADTQGTWRGKGYAQRSSWSALLELALGVACTLAAWDFVERAVWAAVPLALLYGAGFLVVGGLTLAESLGIAQERAGVATRVPMPASRRTTSIEAKAA